MLRLIPAFGFLLAGCAPSAPLVLGPDHPASPEAPTAALAVEVAALAPVAAPDVPAVLRPASRPAAAAHAHGHTRGADPEPGTEPAARTAHPDHGPAAPGMPAPMADALDAYLALHDALAADRTDGEAARAFASAFDALAAAPPEGDPHFWHQRSAEVEAVREAAAALAGAVDLDAARAAFGRLSAPFAMLVEAAGTPAGYDLARHTCGMAPAPEGGVWLQRAGDTRNPYFGTGMLMCSRRADGVTAHGAHAGDHGDSESVDHGAMGHGGSR